MCNKVLQMRVPTELADETRIDPSAQSDETLVHRIATGDAAALDALVRRYRDRLVPFVRRQVAEADVEDVVQDAVARILVQLASFRGDAKFSTWAFSIAQRACADHHRLRSRRPHGHVVDIDTDPSRATAPMDRLEADRQTPDREAMASEVHSRVARAVATLPTEQREVFVLRVHDGLRFGEIADALGIGVPTAKSRMRYAIERLQGQVAELGSWITGSMPALQAR